MRLLHTSDWHLGRSFHGHPTLPQLREVLAAFPRLVREHAVDLVAVAGDVFDHAAPAPEYYEVLAAAIRGIREAGAEVVFISGNHDNATRLGFQSEWAALGGVHMLTRADAFRRPVPLADEHGIVDVYGIPFLEPMLHRGLYPKERLREHRTLLARVMTEVNEQRAARGNRSVVLSHCFAANTGANEGAVSAAVESGRDLVWDLTSGGVDLVPAQVFSGPDYVALGHLHGRSQLAPQIRYSGAPLHFSFSEADRPRGAWLVELGATGFEGADWVPLPIPRPLARLRGTLEELLDTEEYAVHAGSWVEATLTDAVRPIDAMRRLRDRFLHCARIEFAPEGAAPTARRSYAARVSQRSDTEVIDEFLQHVRAGEGLTTEERVVVGEALAAARTDVRPSATTGKAE